VSSIVGGKVNWLFKVCIIVCIIILTNSQIYGIFNMEIESGSFIWDLEKELDNIKKHKVDFNTACEVFKDSKRKVYIDSKHSRKEDRLFCIGKIGNKVLTVRFTYRGYKIRIFGAGYWRKGGKYYEREDNGFK